MSPHPPGAVLAVAEILRKHEFAVGAADGVFGGYIYVSIFIYIYIYTNMYIVYMGHHLLHLKPNVHSPNPRNPKAKLVRGTRNPKARLSRASGT